MMDFLRTRTRPQLIAAVAIALALLATIVLLIASSSPPTRRTLPAPDTPATLVPDSATSQPASPTATSHSGSTRSPTVPATPAPLPMTRSADVYAAAVAQALWTADYAHTSRNGVLAFWKGELATALPAGTPPGTTLAQAQDAALSTLQSYLPSPAMWGTLAREHTTSTFRVTSITEPASWVSAVATGQIIDPGLTARTVLGVQTLTYDTSTGGPTGGRVARQSTAQTQQVIVAMLCPPTSPSCRVEIIPPTDAAGG